MIVHLRPGPSGRSVWMSDVDVSFTTWHAPSVTVRGERTVLSAERGSPRQTRLHSVPL